MYQIRTHCLCTTAANSNTFTHYRKVLLEFTETYLLEIRIYRNAIIRIFATKWHRRGRGRPRPRSVCHKTYDNTVKSTISVTVIWRSVCHKTYDNTVKSTISVTVIWRSVCTKGCVLTDYPLRSVSPSHLSAPLVLLVLLVLSALFARPPWKNALIHILSI